MDNNEFKTYKALILGQSRAEFIRANEVYKQKNDEYHKCRLDYMLVLLQQK